MSSCRLFGVVGAMLVLAGACSAATTPVAAPVAALRGTVPTIASPLPIVVAAGEGGYLVVSTDSCATFARRSSGTGVDLRGLAWDGQNRVVGVGAHGSCASADDGATWQAGSVAATRWLDIVHWVAAPPSLSAAPVASRGRFLAMGHGPTTPTWLLASADGVSWTDLPSTPSGLMRALASNSAGLLVATGEGYMTPGTAYSGPVMYSKDRGATWDVTMTGLGQMGDRFDVAWEPLSKRFVVVGGPVIGGGTVRFSTDGKSWAAPASLQATRLLCVAADGRGRLVACGQHGNTVVSVDGGSTWVSGGRVDPATGGITLHDLTHDGRRFVGVGTQEGVKAPGSFFKGPDEGCIVHSTNGAAWTKVQDLPAPRAKLSAVVALR